MNSIEIKCIELIFNSGGYVLDFTDESFKDFCIRSINKDLKNIYNMSKGKSLMAFFRDDSVDISEKFTLLGDLLKYYETFFLNSKESTKEHGECFFMLKKIISDINPIDAVNIKEVLDSRYIDQQLSAIKSAYEHDNTYDIIGKSKELIESICKDILANTCSKKEMESMNFPELVNSTCQLLSFNNDIITDSLELVKQNAILINKMRNKFGSGHGKEVTFSDIPKSSGLLVFYTTYAILYYFKLLYNEN